MAKATTEAQAKTKKRCPKCGATRFRAHEKGEIINGKLKVNGYDFQCIGCHAVTDGHNQLIDVKA